MIYLRKFNENSETEKDLQSLFSDLLASLIDEDFNIDVNSWGTSEAKIKAKSINSITSNIYKLKITKGNKSIFSGRTEVFDWFDIRDNFIPFMSFMNNEYTILDIFCETPSNTLGYQSRTNRINIDMDSENIISDNLINYKLIDINIIFQVSL